jgi:hypothetical protein
MSGVSLGLGVGMVGEVGRYRDSGCDRLDRCGDSTFSLMALPRCFCHSKRIHQSGYTWTNKGSDDHR